MLQKTPKASKGDWVRKRYFNDFGITRTLTMLIVMYLKNVFDTTILKFENKLQYNLPSGKKRGFADSLARKPLFHSAMFVKEKMFYFVV